MLLVPILSSNLSAMGYDPVNGELQVQFMNGRIYSYQNVPPDLYDGLVNAPSKGTFFAQTIRNQPILYPPLRIL
jgi:hypothetical protein